MPTTSPTIGTSRKLDSNSRLVSAPYNQGVARSGFRFTTRSDQANHFCSGKESTDALITSGTANTEVINFIHIDVRNTTVLSRLAAVGATYSKFRLTAMSAEYSGVVAATTSGEFAMALIYDAADEVAANWSISRILKTHQCQSCPIWSNTNRVVYNPAHAAKPWYLSGTTTGVAAQNSQTPVTIVYGFYSNSTNIPAGRVSISYDIHMIEPVSPVANV